MAANHIFGLGNPVPTATATLAAATLVISAMPAQGQQPSTDQLKAYAQNAVKKRRQAEDQGVLRT